MRYAPITLLAALALAGCEEPQPRTVAEFMADEVALYGTLARCETEPAAGADPECRNARQAAERIAAIEERAMRKGREQAFESARAEYRAQLDRERELRRRAEAETEQARLQALTDLLQGEEDGPGAPAEAAQAGEGVDLGEIAEPEAIEPAGSGDEAPAASEPEEDDRD
jgi:hypothetical protein